MRSSSRLSALLLLAGGLLAPLAANADVVRLKNGRTLEGQIVKRTPREVHVQLATGDGVMIVPMGTVAAIETRDSAHEELVERAVLLDRGDPEAVQELAVWASSRGLGEEAQDLKALAFGVSLDRRVAAARQARSARDFAETFHWARDRGASDEVLAWLVSQAQSICRDDPEVLAVGERLEKDRAAERDRLARQAAARGKPHYLDPGRPRPLVAMSLPAEGSRASSRGRGRERESIATLVGRDRVAPSPPTDAELGVELLEMPKDAR